MSYVIALRSTLKKLKASQKEVATYKHNAELMANYLQDREEADYECECAAREVDGFTINVNDMWHIWQTALYTRKLAGYELDARYVFYNGDKIL